MLQIPRTAINVSGEGCSEILTLARQGGRLKGFLWQGMEVRFLFAYDSLVARGYANCISAARNLSSGPGRLDCCKFKFGKPVRAGIKAC